jgi:hypothetical protein
MIEPQTHTITERLLSETSRSRMRALLPWYVRRPATCVSIHMSRPAIACCQRAREPTGITCCGESHCLWKGLGNDGDDAHHIGYARQTPFTSPYHKDVYCGMACHQRPRELWNSRHHNRLATVQRQERMYQVDRVEFARAWWAARASPATLPFEHAGVPFRKTKPELVGVARRHCVPCGCEELYLAEAIFIARDSIV